MFTFISSSVGEESLQRIIANISIGSVLLLILFVITFHVYRYGNERVYSLLERTCLCRVLKRYNHGQTRNHWNQLDSPLLDVIDNPRDDSDVINYTQSSLILPTRSTASMADAEGASVAVPTIGQSTEESFNSPQHLTTDSKSFIKMSNFQLGTSQIADSNPFSSTKIRISSIKQPLLEEGQ